MEISIAEAETILDELVDLAVDCEEIIFTQDGLAVARLVPIAKPSGTDVCPDGTGNRI